MLLLIFLLSLYYYYINFPTSKLINRIKIRFIYNSNINIFINITTLCIVNWIAGIIYQV